MRKINVNGLEYEWVAGNAFVKIVGPNFSKVIAGRDLVRWDKIDELLKNAACPDSTAQVSVRPEIIRDYIEQILKIGEFKAKFNPFIVPCELCR